MKLRIVSGTLRGRYLTLSDTWAKFRPTQERVRQSVMEIIKDRIPGAMAADLCAGSGAFGFELLSRGALSVDFVERDRKCGMKILEHAGALHCDGQCRTSIEDVRRFITRSRGGYDIIFYDPPYEDRSLIPRSAAAAGASGEGRCIYL